MEAISVTVHKKKMRIGMRLHKFPYGIDFYTEEITVLIPIFNFFFSDYNSFNKRNFFI